MKKWAIVLFFVVPYKNILHFPFLWFYNQNLQKFWFNCFSLDVATQQMMTEDTALFTTDLQHLSPNEEEIKLPKDS